MGGGRRDHGRQRQQGHPGRQSRARPRNPQHAGRHTVANLSLATSESWRDKSIRRAARAHRMAPRRDLQRAPGRRGREVPAQGLEGLHRRRSCRPANGRTSPGQEKYTTEVVLQRFRGELTMLDGRGAAARPASYAERRLMSGPSHRAAAAAAAGRRARAATSTTRSRSKSADSPEPDPKFATIKHGEPFHDASEALLHCGGELLAPRFQPRAGRRRISALRRCRWLRAVRRGAGSLTFFTWGGYDVPERGPQYVEKYGGPPEFAIFASEEEALQKMLAGFERRSGPSLQLQHQALEGRRRPAGRSTSRACPSTSNIWERFRTIPSTSFDGKVVLHSLGCRRLSSIALPHRPGRSGRCRRSVLGPAVQREVQGPAVDVRHRHDVHRNRGARCRHGTTTICI